MRCGSVVGGEEQEVWRGGRMAWPTVGSASQRSILSRVVSSRRREQVVPAVLEEEDERLKMDVGHWM